MATKNLKEIPLTALKTGMTVVKLDISWLDSPFLTHTRKIRGQQDVNSLRNAGVKTVVIDLDQSPEYEHETLPEEATPSAAPDANLQEQCAAAPAGVPEPTPAVANVALAPIIKPSVKDELKVARELSKQVKSAVHDLQRRLENDIPIQSSELTPLIDATFQSLERNNQALLSLVHLSRKSQKLSDHAFGCFCLALNLALVRKLSFEERECLGLAALLHEAGWLSIPLQLMGKRTPYSANERKLVENHTSLAGKVLANSDIPPLVLRLVAEHHEHMDGSGYPKGLTKGDIHPLTGLLTIVDTYEERVHQLMDRPGMIPTNAMRSIYVDAEKGLYDREVAANFISMLGIYPVLTAVKLNTGERGLIRELHENAPLLPTVEIHYGADNKPLSRPLEVDLRAQKSSNVRAIDSAFDPQDVALDPLRRLLPEEGDLF